MASESGQRPHSSSLYKPYKLSKPIQPPPDHYPPSSRVSSSRNSKTASMRLYTQSTEPSDSGHIITFYGREEITKICTRYLVHNFKCPDLPFSHSRWPPSLTQFIAQALHQTRLHNTVAYAALALLQRLKARFPLARGSSGHRLFLSALMVSSKIVVDDTYSNKCWAVVGQGMFALREISQMEREICAYIDWNLNIPPEELRQFEKEVRGIYSQPPPYSYTSITSLSVSGGANAEKDGGERSQQLPTLVDTGPTQAPFSSQYHEEFPAKPNLRPHPLSSAILTDSWTSSHYPPPPLSPATDGSDSSLSSPGS